MNLSSTTLNVPHIGLRILSFALLLTVAQGSHGQTPPPKVSEPQPKSATSVPAKLSLEQDLSLSLLRSVADESKGETDKPAAALLQAEAADTLWQFDEVGARSLFRLAFETARTEPAEASAIDKEAKAKQIDLARRRAFTLREIIVMVGKHDRPTAERFLASLNENKTNKEATANQTSQPNAEFLAYLAVQLVKTNPDEAQRLGLLSLNSQEVPSAFGRLLIALKSVDSSKGDALFKAAIEAMRRGVSPGAALSVLSNYVFLNAGSEIIITDASNAALFVDYLLEAANVQLALARDARNAKAPMPESAVRLTNFLALRGLAIVGRTAPDKLVLLRSTFNELSSALSQQQLDDLKLMTTGVRQMEAMNSRSEGGLDEEIQRAEREKDAVVRDQLWRRLATGMMRGDPDRALQLADKIDDKALREQTQDDINLVEAADVLRGGSYENARQVALKFNDTNLRSKTLAEVADRVWARSKNREKATELLSEAYEIAAKGEPSADRAAITLLLAQKFVKLDSERSFSLLDAAIRTINHVQIAGQPSPSLLPRGRFGVIHITVVGGVELTTGVHATLDSLSFSGLAGLVKTDYYRSRNLGDNIQNKILRGQYLITLAQSFLNPNVPIKDSFLPPFPQ
jgi:hypothetical protein